MSTEPPPAGAPIRPGAPAAAQLPAAKPHISAGTTPPPALDVTRPVLRATCAWPIVINPTPVMAAATIRRITRSHTRSVPVPVHSVHVPVAGRPTRPTGIDRSQLTHNRTTTAAAGLGIHIPWPGEENFQRLAALANARETARIARDPPSRPAAFDQWAREH